MLLPGENGERCKDALRYQQYRLLRRPRYAHNRRLTTKCLRANCWPSLSSDAITSEGVHPPWCSAAARSSPGPSGSPLASQFGPRPPQSRPMFHHRPRMHVKPGGCQPTPLSAAMAVSMAEGLQLQQIAALSAPGLPQHPHEELLPCQVLVSVVNTLPFPPHRRRIAPFSPTD